MLSDWNDWSCAGVNGINICRIIMKNQLLLIPQKSDIELDAVADAWMQKGGALKRIGKFWVKPKVANQEVSLYGNDTFCLVLGQILGLTLLSPKDEWIAELEEKWTKRAIAIVPIQDLQQVAFPQFVKPVIPKQFPAAVFSSITDLHPSIQGLEGKERLICSEIVDVESEVRCFVLDRKVKDLAFYEGSGKLEEAKAFIEAFLEECILDLPATFVLDVGFNQKIGWFILEFNAMWGAGLNGCKPERVLDCILVASVH